MLRWYAHCKADVRAVSVDKDAPKTDQQINENTHEQSTERGRATESRGIDLFDGGGLKQQEE